VHHFLRLAVLVLERVEAPVADGLERGAGEFVALRRLDDRDLFDAAVLADDVANHQHVFPAARLRVLGIRRVLLRHRRHRQRQIALDLDQIGQRLRLQSADRTAEEAADLAALDAAGDAAFDARGVRRRHFLHRRRRLDGLRDDRDLVGDERRRDQRHLHRHRLDHRLNRRRPRRGRWGRRRGRGRRGLGQRVGHEHLRRVTGEVDVPDRRADRAESEETVHGERHGQRHVEDAAARPGDRSGNDGLEHEWLGLPAQVSTRLIPECATRM
jgi:hypothetical protein